MAENIYDTIAVGSGIKELIENELEVLMLQRGRKYRAHKALCRANLSHYMKVNRTSIIRILGILLILIATTFNIFSQPGIRFNHTLSQKLLLPGIATLPRRMPSFYLMVLVFRSGRAKEAEK